MNDYRSRRAHTKRLPPGAVFLGQNVCAECFTNNRTYKIAIYGLGRRMLTDKQSCRPGFIKFIGLIGNRTSLEPINARKARNTYLEQGVLACPGISKSATAKSKCDDKDN